MAGRLSQLAIGRRWHDNALHFAHGARNRLRSRITISVTPGQEGQVFIGTSAMSTDLDGVVALLYPNTLGRWSEQFDLIDPQGDGIDLSALYIMGEIAGEYVQVVTETTGITPATPFERLPGQCHLVSRRLLHRKYVYLCGPAHRLSRKRARFRAAHPG